MEALDCNINKEKKEEENHRKSHRKKERNNKRNSPHSEWSLHNNLSRKFRNIVPEMPTQNMATQPQSIEPLISPHRSHSCNINNTVFNTTTEPKLYNKLYIYIYRKILTDIVCWQQKGTTYSRIHIVLTGRQAQVRCSC